MKLSPLTPKASKLLLRPLAEAVDLHLTQGVESVEKVMLAATDTTMVNLAKTLAGETTEDAPSVSDEERQDMRVAAFTTLVARSIERALDALDDADAKKLCDSVIERVVPLVQSRRLIQATAVAVDEETLGRLKNDSGLLRRKAESALREALEQDEKIVDFPTFRGGSKKEQIH